MLISSLKANEKESYHSLYVNMWDAFIEKWYIKVTLTSQEQLRKIKIGIMSDGNTVIILGIDNPKYIVDLYIKHTFKGKKITYESLRIIKQEKQNEKQI